MVIKTSFYKRAAVFSMLGAVLATSTPAFALTTQERLVLIASLTQQLAALQAQLQALQQQRTTAEVSLLRMLKPGERGEDVKVLQALLAADSSIYPEGIINGSYGPATTRAVKRFQARKGLAQPGVVGPATLKKLNEELKDKPIAIETDGSGKPALCAKVPPGHLIAPGWLRKNDGVRPIVPECQTLPPGIASTLSTSTTPIPPLSVNDVMPPTISSTAISGITGNSVIVTWTTNEQTKSRVYYSTSTMNFSSTAPAYASDDSFVVIHSTQLSGLLANAVYYYLIIATDQSGNTASSSQGMFTTINSSGDITPPNISSVSSSNVGATMATITWSTDESANSKVYYGTTNSISTNLSAAQAYFDSSFATSHSASLSGFTQNTIYYYMVVSADASGNAASSSQQSFATLQPDTASPVVSSISISGVTAGAASLSWTTNENAKSKVYYGTNFPLNLASATFIANTALGTSHAIVLSNLSTSTTYYYVISSSDSSGNTTNATESSFTTTAGTDTTPPVISSVVAGTFTPTGATITWTTNENATSKVYYSDSTPVNTSTAQAVSDSTLVTSHSLAITGLSGNTPYYYSVQSADSVGNQVVSTESSFTTAP